MDKPSISPSSQNNSSYYSTDIENSPRSDFLEAAEIQSDLICRINLIINELHIDSEPLAARLDSDTIQALQERIKIAKNLIERVEDNDLSIPLMKKLNDFILNKKFLHKNLIKESKKLDTPKQTEELTVGNASSAISNFSNQTLSKDKSDAEKLKSADEDGANCQPCSLFERMPLTELSSAEKERYLAKTLAKFSQLKIQYAVLCDLKATPSDKEALKAAMKANIASIKKELSPLSIIYPNVIAFITSELKPIQETLLIIESSSAEKAQYLAKTLAKFSQLKIEYEMLCDLKATPSDKEALKAAMESNIASIKEELLLLSIVYPDVTAFIGLELGTMEKSLP